MKQPWFETSGWHVASSSWFTGNRAVATSAAEGTDAQQRREPEPPRERDRTVAPPIEREHETYAGVFEEDERRSRRKDPGTRA